MSSNTPNRGNNMPTSKEDIASQHIDLVQYENESDKEFQARVDAQSDQSSTSSTIRSE